MEEPYLMRIGEIAAFYNVSRKAIRLYEKKGLLTPEVTDPETGYRYYSADQVKQLDALLELKALGFSLVEIKSILTGGTSAEDFLEALRRKQMAWQDAVAAAEDKMNAIGSILQRFAQSREGIKLQELTEDERAWLLVKMVCVEDLHGQNVLSEAIWL